MTPSLAAVAAAALAAAALAGCFTASHNAPGVIDIRTPPPPRTERGDPAAFEPAKTPGQRTLTAIVGASFLACIGCATADAPDSGSAGEMGGEIILEYRASDRDAYDGFDAMRGRAWGLALGFQAGFGHNERAGTFHASLNRRMLAFSMVPAAVNVGIAIATDGMPGIQASAHYTMLMIRGRAIADHGAELLLGIEWPIPLVFSWSR